MKFFKLINKKYKPLALVMGTTKEVALETFKKHCPHIDCEYGIYEITVCECRELFAEFMSVYFNESRIYSDSELDYCIKSYDSATLSLHKDFWEEL